MKPSHYTRHDLVLALRAVGARRGDIAFSHGNLGFFGYPAEGRTPDLIFGTVLDAFREVLGDEGTLVVPTFTYSFCKNQPFDPNATPSSCGAFTEWIRKRDDAVRSIDPIFSIAAVGLRAEEMTRRAPEECFGNDSFWGRFLDADGIVCNLNFDAGSTFIHHVERRLNVPYRYDKEFRGTFIEHEKSRPGRSIFFCQDLSNPLTVAAFEKFDRLARSASVAKQAPVGRGSIVGIRAAGTYDLIAKALPADPFLLTVAGERGETPTLRRAPTRNAAKLPKEASTNAIVDALHPLPRDLVSDGLPIAIDALASCLPLERLEWPTGTRIGDELVPEHWQIESASIETITGDVVLSTSNESLAVASYSASCDRILSRDELLALIQVHPRLDHALLRIPRAQGRRVAISTTRDARAALTQPSYRLRITTRQAFGSLVAGESVRTGSAPGGTMVRASLLEPSSIAVAANAWRALEAGTARATRRLLIVSDDLALRARLRSLDASQRPDTLVLVGSLGLPHRLRLDISDSTNAATRAALSDFAAEHDLAIEPEPFAASTLLVDLPPDMAPRAIVAIAAALPKGSPDAPYREWSSSEDLPSLYTAENLARSSLALQKLVELVSAG